MLQPFVLFLAGGCLAFVLYLAALSKRTKRQNESEPISPDKTGSKKNVA